MSQCAGSVCVFLANRWQIECFIPDLNLTSGQLHGTDWILEWDHFSFLTLNVHGILSIYKLQGLGTNASFQVCLVKLLVFHFMFLLWCCCCWLLLYSAILRSWADSLRSCWMRFCILYIYVYFVFCTSEIVTFHSAFLNIHQMMYLQCYIATWNCCHCCRLGMLCTAMPHITSLQAKPHT